jgi:hypothetical protein
MGVMGEELFVDGKYGKGSRKTGGRLMSNWLTVKASGESHLISLEEGSKLVGLDKEIILCDLGKSLLKAERIDGKWQFDR